MSDDPLQRFRRPGGAPEPAPQPATPAASKDEYEPFKSVTRRQLRLKIRPYLRAWERIGYAYLHRIVEDGDYGKQIALVYQFAVIVIKGRNLQVIAEAIGDEQCEFIQAFDPDKWEQPSDESKPFIESIDIHVQSREQMVKATDDALTDIAKSSRAIGN